MGVPEATEPRPDTGSGGPASSPAIENRVKVGTELGPRAPRTSSVTEHSSGALKKEGWPRLWRSPLLSWTTDLACISGGACCVIGRMQDSSASYVNSSSYIDPETQSLLTFRGSTVTEPPCASTFCVYLSPRPVGHQPGAPTYPLCKPPTRIPASREVREIEDHSPLKPSISVSVQAERGNPTLVSSSCRSGLFAVGRHHP